MNTTNPPSLPGALDVLDVLRAALGPRIVAGLDCGLPPHPENGAAVPPPLPSSAETSPFAPSEPPQPARHPGGRRNTCTPDTLEMICEGIAKGLSDTAAAALIGVPASTLSRWKKDQDGVVDTFTAARERYRALLLDRLHNAKTRDGRDDWRATAWLLERSFPEDYGRKRLSQPSPQNDTQYPSAPWNDSLDPEPERPRRDRWTPFIAERRRQEAELAAREAEFASQAQTFVPPSSETSETGSHVPNSAAHKPAPNSSETSETPASTGVEATEFAPDLHEADSDSFPAQLGLSRRERRRRAHLQRKAQAAQQRAAAKIAPLAAEA